MNTSEFKLLYFTPANGLKYTHIEWFALCKFVKKLT